jgi:HlyD family secretion protein
MPTSLLAARRFVPRLLLAAALCMVAQQGFAADDPDAPKGAAVTVIKAEKSCFAAIVEVTGILLPRDEVAIRPDRPGLKVAEVLVDAGETVTAGQTLARLTLPEGGAVPVQASVAGLVSTSSAVVGTIASGKGEALFSIIPRSEFEMVGQVPTRDLPKLAVNQAAEIKIIGVGALDGKVRRVASTVEPNSQLGQVFVTITSTRRLMANSYARALIKTGESCGVSVPLTAILYGSAGTVVQVVRRQRIETRRVEVGLMSGGRVEIREGIAEGDMVVARAGALLREGDPVRPLTADATAAAAK